MFLIRTAFWLSLVILFLPTGESGTSETDSASAGAPVSALEALSVAQNTVSDLAGFCDRNPDTCETGSAAFKTFGQKAQYGAMKVYEFIAQANAPDDPTSLDGLSGAGSSGADFARDGIDTLLRQDKDVPWQGPGTQG